MGDEPPDPGGTVPQVSHYVTIEHCESSMDTDASSVNNAKLLRKRTY